MSLTTRDSRLEIKSLNAAGMFSGYGSVFDVPDLGDDVVCKGAFCDSLTAWNTKGDLPALLWQHRSSEPIGAYTRMSEDDKGLFVEGQLALKTARGLEAYELLKMKAIKGLSIGFLTREDSMDRKTGVRSIKKADLWEVSIVTFPMNESAQIDTVKAVPDFSSIADFERYLRDTGPYSRTSVMTMMQKAKKLFQRDTGASDDAQAKVLRALNRRVIAMKDAEDGSDPTPETDDGCSLPGGCCMPDGCCNSMGKCVACAIGATGPMP